MSPGAGRRKGWLLVWGVLGVAASRAASRTEWLRALRWRLRGGDPVAEFTGAPCYRDDGSADDRAARDDAAVSR